MWPVLSVSIHKPTTPPISAYVLANSQPPRRRSSANRQQQATKNNRENLNNQRGAATNQLSGLDVLWAMQRAADEKNSRIKRNRKRPESESESEPISNCGVDYSNTRPLIIKDDWGSRLDELEKRLGDQINKF